MAGACFSRCKETGGGLQGPPLGVKFWLVLPDLTSLGLRFFRQKTDNTSKDQGNERMHERVEAQKKSLQAYKEPVGGRLDLSGPQRGPSLCPRRRSFHCRVQIPQGSFQSPPSPARSAMGSEEEASQITAVAKRLPGKSFNPDYNPKR